MAGVVIIVNAAGVVKGRKCLYHGPRDWPDQDATTASMTSGATSFSVVDTSIYSRLSSVYV
jgi:hypothetical protein